MRKYLNFMVQLSRIAENIGLNSYLYDLIIIRKGTRGVVKLMRRMNDTSYDEVIYYHTWSGFTSKSQGLRQGFQEEKQKEQDIQLVVIDSEWLTD